MCKLCLNTRLKFNVIMTHNKENSGGNYSSVSDFLMGDCRCLKDSQCCSGECSQCRCSLNSTLLEINVSPFKTHAIAAHSLITHVKKKLQQCLESFSEKQTDIRDKVETVLDIESRQLESSYDNQSPDKLLERKADDLDRLLSLIKEKMIISNRPEKIKLLTLVPLSWKQNEILDFFPVTKYMITESKKLLQEKGILASPEPKKGRSLPKIL